MNRVAPPIFSHFDDSFTLHSSRNYCLAILVARNGLTYCISRAEDNFILGVESHNFINSDTHQPAGSDIKEWCLQLTALLGSLESLKKSFRKVSIAIGYPKSTLVPDVFFEVDQQDDWLRFNHPVAGYEINRNDDLRSAEAVLLYAVPSEILSILAASFPEATIVNASGQLISSLLTATKAPARDGVIYAHVQGASLEFVYLEGGRLKFFNIFSYKTREDLAYYIIFVIEQLGLNPDTTVLVLLGDIERESDQFELLYRYIRNIRLIDNSIMLDRGQITEGIPFHTYFNLLNLARCGS